MLALSALALACTPATAGASLKVSAWTSGEHLAVARDGSAQITWREEGSTRTAVVRGSRISYRARIGCHHIGRHVAPDVAYGRDEVVLPNGTHYALQRVRRLGQFGQMGAPELRFARWRGEQPRLSLTGEWAYHGRFPRICGTATYHGQAFFGGAHTLSGRPLDAFGRNVYIDVLRSNGLVPHHGRAHAPEGVRAPDPRQPPGAARSTAPSSPARTSTATWHPTSPPARRCRRTARRRRLPVRDRRLPQRLQPTLGQAGSIASAISIRRSISAKPASQQSSREMSRPMPASCSWGEAAPPIERKSRYGPTNASPSSR